MLETSDSDLLGTNIQLLGQELPSVIPSTRENSHCLRVLSGVSYGVCSSVSWLNCVGAISLVSALLACQWAPFLTPTFSFS